MYQASFVAAMVILQSREAASKTTPSDRQTPSAAVSFPVAATAAKQKSSRTSQLNQVVMAAKQLFIRQRS